LLYVLPYHGLRAPHGPWRSGEPFFDLDMVRTNEAFAQAIYELRALIRYLRTRQTGPVGAFGMSLGGYTTALLATVEPELARADRICPPSQAEALWMHWNRPRIHWYPGGHLAQFRRYRALRQIRRLLRD